MQTKIKTVYGCTVCKKGFHVNCLTAYHCHSALTGKLKALMEMVKITNDEDRIGQYTGNVVYKRY